MFIEEEYGCKWARKRTLLGLCVGFLLIGSMLILPTLDVDAQSCNLSLYFPSSIQTNASANLSISGTLYNSASTSDFAIITVSSPSNWTVSVTPSDTYIATHTNVSLTVSCMVPSGVNPGSYTLTISAKSNITQCTTSTNISIIVSQTPSQGYLSVSLDVFDYDNEGLNNDLFLLAEYYTGTSYVPASYAHVNIDNIITNASTDYNGSFYAYDFPPGEHLVYVTYMTPSDMLEWQGSFYIEDIFPSPNETILQLWANPADLDSDGHLNDVEIYAYFETQNGYTYLAPYTEIYIDQIYMGSTDYSGYFVAFDFSAGYHSVYAYYYQFYYNNSGNFSGSYTAYAEFYSEGLGEIQNGIYLSISVSTFDNDGVFNDAIFYVYYYSTSSYNNSHNGSGGRQSYPPSQGNGTLPTDPVEGVEIYVDYYFVGLTDANGILIKNDFTAGWHLAEAYYLTTNSGYNCSNCTSYMYDSEWFYISAENSASTNLGVSAYTFANDNDAIINDVIIMASYYTTSANYSSPASLLEVFIEGIFVGYTNENGTWRGYNYPPGIYDVLVFGNNCTATTTFTIEHVSTSPYTISAYVLNLDNEIISNDVKIIVRNSAAGLPNASIYIDWLFYGFTNTLGELTIYDLESGYHIATWFDGIFIDFNYLNSSYIHSSNSSYTWTLAWDNLYSTTFYIPYSVTYLTNWSFQHGFCMADFDNDTYLDDLVIILPLQGNFSANALNVSIDGNKVTYSYRSGRGSGERIVVYDLSPGPHDISVTYSGTTVFGKVVSQGTGQQFIYATVYLTNADSGTYRNDAQILIRDQNGLPVQGASININNTINGITNPTGVFVAYNLTKGTHSGTATAPNGKTASFVINSEGLENHAPHASAGSDFIVNLGSEANFNASESYDPDGDLLSFVWNFGDGTTANGIKVSHTYTTYPENGEYIVTLTVTDTFGAYATATIKVRINRIPIAKIASVPAKVVGSKIVFDALGSSDEDNDALTYTWDFGDGTTATGANPTHVYSKPGTYDVKLTVSDGRGGTSSTTMRIIIKEKATTTGYPLEIIMLLIAVTLGAAGLMFFFRRKRRNEKI